MNIRLAAALTLVSIVLALSGCAVPKQSPVFLSEDSLNAQSGRVGVVMAALPKVDTEFPGVSCLLCMAAASMTNSKLTSHAQTLPYEDLPKLKDKIAELMRKRGMNVVLTDGELDIKQLPDSANKGPNIAVKDFSSLQVKYGISKLVVIDITGVGFTRSYSAYIPTSEPKALLRGVGYMIDLKTNSYSWYQPVTIMKSADGAWDEPPNFPGLTNAYFQALELGMENFLRPFGTPAAQARSSPAAPAMMPVSNSPQNAR